MLLSMKSSLLVLATVFIASGVTAKPLDAGSGRPLHKRLVFHQVEAGAVEANDSRFQPRKDGNRVFYAATFRQGRGWAGVTSIPANLEPYDFSKYAVLAVFYKGCTLYGLDLNPVASVQESVTGDLSATITLNPAACAAPPDPELWGMYILTIIDKRSLDQRPKTLHVTTHFQS
jgi:hypothetical protein